MRLQVCATATAISCAEELRTVLKKKICAQLSTDELQSDLREEIGFSERTVSDTAMVHIAAKLCVILRSRWYTIVPLEGKIELERQWTEVHADFMNLLKSKYPDFTLMELKIATLLKMKLTSSNISAILFLSKRTVEFHRLNIRKKMLLKKEDDLYTLLVQLRVES